MTPPIVFPIVGSQKVKLTGAQQGKDKVTGAAMLAFLPRFLPRKRTIVHRVVMTAPEPGTFTDTTTGKKADAFEGWLIDTTGKKMSTGLMRSRRQGVFKLTFIAPIDDPGSKSTFIEKGFDVNNLQKAVITAEDTDGPPRPGPPIAEARFGG